MKELIIAIVTILLIYLIGCFINLSFNIYYWTGVSRILVGLMAPVIAFVFCGMYIDSKPKK